MKKLTLSKLTIILATAVFALGLFQVAIGGPNDSPVPRDKSMITPGPKGDPGVVATIAAGMNQATERSLQAHAEWLATFVASGTDPKGLPLVESNADAQPAPATLEASLAQANVIASGTVTDVRYLPNMTAVTFAINDSAKGQTGGQPLVTVVIPFGPTRDARDPSKAVLEYMPSAPPLFKGDKAILVLQNLPMPPAGLNNEGPVFYPQPNAGIYKVNAAGGVQFDPSRLPFAAELQGKSAQQTMELFKQRSR